MPRPTTSCRRTRAGRAARHRPQHRRHVRHVRQGSPRGRCRHRRSASGDRTGAGVPGQWPARATGAARCRNRSWPPSSRRRRRATAGCTSSSGTATGCWPTSRKAACGCARATAWTGPATTRTSSRRLKRWDWTTAALMANWSRWTPTAAATSTHCREPCRATVPRRSATSCSTCRCWRTSTSRAPRWSTARRCSRICLPTPMPARWPTAGTSSATARRCSRPAAGRAWRASSARRWMRPTRRDVQRRG